MVWCLKRFGCGRWHMALIVMEHVASTGGYCDVHTGFPFSHHHLIGSCQRSTDMVSVKPGSPLDFFPI